MNESIKISKGKKIVHFCNYGPADSGMYKTTRDLVYEELKVGYNAWVVDTIANNKIRHKGIYHDSLFKDGRVIGFENYDISLRADLICWHSWIPQDYLNDGSRNLVMFLHGMPSFVFYNELYNIEPVLSFLRRSYYDIPHCHFYITLWPSHKPFWENILMDKLVVTSSWIPFDSFVLKPDSGFDASHLKLAAMDTWRAGKEPYYIINAAQILMSQYERKEIPCKVTLDIYGQDVNNVQPVWSAIIRKGFEKYVYFKGKDNPAAIFESHDILLTQIGGTYTESRIVREGLLSGIPIVSGYPYAAWTPFKHDCRDIEGYADMIMHCRNLMQKRKKRLQMYHRNREYARKNFDIVKNAAPIFKCYEKIFKKAQEEKKQIDSLSLHDCKK